MNEMDSLRYWLWFVDKEMGGGERPPLQGSQIKHKAHRYRAHPSDIWYSYQEILS